MSPYKGEILIYQIIRHREWYGVEEFGGAVAFDAGKAKGELRTLAKAIGTVNVAMDGFIKRMRDFNQAAGSAQGLTKLIQSLEAAVAKQAKFAKSQEQTSKEMINANTIINQQSKQILSINTVYDKNNQLLKTRTVFLDQMGRKVTVLAGKEGQLLSLRRSQKIATEAQLRAEQKLAGQVERATSAYSNFSRQVSTGQLRIVSTSKTVNTAMDRTQQIMKVMDAQGRLLNVTLTRTGGSLTNFQSRLASTNTGLGRTKGLLGDLTLSWASFARIIAVQLIHRSISRLIQLFREGVRTASEFQIKISEVRTISQQAQLSTTQWGDGLRRLSDSFGLDVLDQTEAAYQSLSNQVVKGAETFLFLEQANRLAIATVSDTATAVSGLTALLNSYRLNVSESDAISAKLFKTVELGRLRLVDISDSIGNVAILANRLNIPMEQLLAGIATLTRQGVGAEEAMTLLRNVFLALIRPTKNMRELFAELGVESGEQLIAQGSLVEVFAELEKRTKGSTSALAQYFGRIRGIVGASAFAAKGLDLFADSVDEITDASDSFNAAVEIGFESSAKKIAIELNKIRNAFVTDFGEPFLEVILLVNKELGGFSNLVKSVGQSIRQGLSTYREYKQLFDDLFVVLDNQKAALKFFLNFVTASARAEEAAIEAQREFNERVKERQEVVRKAVDANIKAIDDEAKAFSKAVSSIRGASTKVIREQLDLDKEVAKNIKNAYTTVLSELQKQLKDYNNALKESTQLADTTAKQIESLRARLNREIFDIRFGELEGAQEQLQALEARIQQLQNVIRDNVNKTSAESRKAIDEAFKELAARSKQFADVTKKAGTTRIKDQENLNKAIADEKKIRADIAKLQRDATAKQTEAQRKLLKAARDSEYSATIRRSSTGGTRVTSRDPEIRRQQEANIRALLDTEEKRRRLNQKLVENLQKQKDLKQDITNSTLKDFDLAKKIEELGQQELKILQDREAFARAEAKRQGELVKQQEERIRKFKELLQDTLKFRFKDVIKPRDFAEVIENARIELKKIEEVSLTLFKDKDLLNLKGSERLIGELAKRSEELNRVVIESERKQRLSIIDQEIKKRREQQNELIKKQGELAKQQELTSERSVRRIQEEAKIFKQATASFIKGENLKELNKVIDAFIKAPSKQSQNALSNFIIGIARKRLPFAREEVLDAFKEFIPSINRFAEGVQESETSRLALETQRIKAEQEAKTLQEELKKLQTREEQKSTERNELLKEANKKQVSMVDILGKILLEQQKIVNYQRVNTSSSPATRQFGGPIGTDKIPALLSPGEFVVNAKATKRFYSQLVAMNANTPQRFESGGIVTNVGDINVSMTSSGNESVDVTKIGKLLRREIRRGTLKLN